MDGGKLKVEEGPSSLSSSSSISKLERWTKRARRRGRTPLAARRRARRPRLSRRRSPQLLVALVWPMRETAVVVIIIVVVDLKGGVDEVARRRRPGPIRSCCHRPRPPRLSHRG